MSYLIPFPQLNNSQINKQLLSCGDNTILVHSDISKLLLFKFENKKDYINSHLNNLFQITDGLNLWMPSFNYDFANTLIYNVDKDSIQVGVLNTFFNKKASWRTTTPIFNFCGYGLYPIPKLKSNVIINPFSYFSEFDFLYKNNSIYGFYGANLSHCTLLHYAEFVSQNLKYRYSKFFKGKVITSNQEVIITLDYYVRPLNGLVIYDWKIKRGLKSSNYMIQTQDLVILFSNIKNS